MKGLPAPTRRALLPVVALVVLLFSWMLVRPVGGFPDDSFHFANIWCDDGIAGFRCSDIEGTATRLVPNVFTDGSPWWGASDFGVNITNTGSLYPNAYYDFMRLFASESVVRSVLAMRVINSLITLAMLSAAFRLVHPLRRLSVTLTWMLMAPGLGLFYVVSNHPFSWLYLGAATGWVYSLSLIESVRWSDRLTSLAGLSIATVMMLGSRPEGRVIAPLVVVVGFCLADGTWLRRLASRLHRSGRRVSLVLGVAAVSASTVLLLMGSSSRVVRTFLDEFGKSLKQGRLTELIDVPYLYFLVIGANVSPTEFGVAGAQSVFLLVAVAGALTIGLQGASWFRRSLLVIATTLAASAPLVYTDKNVSVVGTPPRYLVVMALLVIAIALSYRSPSREASESRGWVVPVGALVIGHSFALHSAIRSYQIGVPPEWSFGLNGGLKWWWPLGPSPQSIWLMGTLGFAYLGYWVLQLKSSVSVVDRA